MIKQWTWRMYRVCLNVKICLNKESCSTHLSTNNKDDIVHLAKV